MITLSSLAAADLSRRNRVRSRWHAEQIRNAGRAPSALRLRAGFAVARRCRKGALQRLNLRAGCRQRRCGGTCELWPSSHLRARRAVPAAPAGQLRLLDAKARVVVLRKRCRSLNLLQLRVAKARENHKPRGTARERGERDAPAKARCRTRPPAAGRRAARQRSWRARRAAPHTSARQRAHQLVRERGAAVTASCKPLASFVPCLQLVQLRAATCQRRR